NFVLWPLVCSTLTDFAGWQHSRPHDSINIPGRPRGSTISDKRGPRRSSLVIESPILPTQPIEPMLPPPFPQDELPAFAEEKMEKDKEVAPTLTTDDREHKADIEWDDTTITTQFTGKFS